MVSFYVYKGSGMTSKGLLGLGHIRPVVQCLQCILSTQFDDLFPLMFSSICDLYLNQILASDRVRFAR